MPEIIPVFASSVIPTGNTAGERRAYTFGFVPPVADTSTV